MNVKTLFHLLILLLCLLAGRPDVCSQTKSLIYEIDDTQVFEQSDADIYALSNGNVLVIFMLNTLDSDRGFNRIAIQEYDTCGLIQENVLVVERNFGIRYIRDINEQGDSLFIIGQGGSTIGEHGDAEGFVLTLDKNTLEGQYRYFRTQGGVYFLNLDFKSDGGYVVMGFFSRTMSIPSRYFVMHLNESYQIESTHEFTPLFSIAGGIITLPNNQYLIRTATQLFVVDQLFNLIWSREFDRYTYGEQTFVEPDGIVMMNYGWYGDSELQIVKINFDGELMWSSPRLNRRLDINGIAKLLKTNNGEYVVVNHSYDFEEYQGDIEITRLNFKGEVLGQEAIEISDNLNDFETMREVTYTDEALYIVTKNRYGKIRMYQSDHEHDICGKRSFDYTIEEDYEWYVESTPIDFIESDVFSTGLYNLQPQSIDLNTNIVCKEEYPLYDLIPSDTILCEGYGIRVDLEIIEDDVFWSDGSQHKVRILTEAGEYAYRYGSCETEYAETISISVDDCTCDVYVPNAFSPNNDGINDEFKIFSPCDLSLNSTIKIYDRWGSRVFSSTAEQESWDGTIKGQPATKGVYVYEIQYDEILLPIEISKSLKGELTLFR